VTVAHTGPARNHPDYDLLTLANAVLGGGFISRLNLNLREDKGWSYGARSKLAEQAGIGEVTAGAAVQTDKTAASMAEIARELRDIASSRPPTPAEIQTAKNTMLLGLTATLQDPSGAAKLYQNMQKFDLPENYYNTYVQRIQGFSTEQVQAAAKRLYRPSELTWFVVGDLAKIEKEVRALKLGEVMVYDADGKRLR
jgi:zinc protease